MILKGVSEEAERSFGEAVNNQGPAVGVEDPELDTQKLAVHIKTF